MKIKINGSHYLQMQPGKAKACIRLPKRQTKYVSISHSLHATWTVTCSHSWQLCLDSVSSLPQTSTWPANRNRTDRRQGSVLQETCTGVSQRSNASCSAFRQVWHRESQEVLCHVKHERLFFPVINLSTFSLRSSQSISRFGLRLPKRLLWQVSFPSFTLWIIALILIDATILPYKGRQRHTEAVKFSGLMANRERL